MSPHAVELVVCCLSSLLVGAFLGGALVNGMHELQDEQDYQRRRQEECDAYKNMRDR